MAAERLVRGQWLRDEGDLVRVRVRVRVLVTLTLTLTLAMRKATSSLIGVSAVSSTTHRVSETCVNAVDGTIVWPGTKQQNDMRAAEEVWVRASRVKLPCVRARVQTEDASRTWRRKHGTCSENRLKTAGPLGELAVARLGFNS